MIIRIIPRSLRRYALREKAYHKDHASAFPECTATTHKGDYED